MKQREIKFRVWNGEKYILSDSNIKFFLDGSIQRNAENRDIEYILQQYTGLKDKNGKEIYEGDILKGDVLVDNNLVNGRNTYFATGKVYYDHTAFRLETIHSKTSPEITENYFDFIGGGYVMEDFVDYEIIGNIYENPDLIK